MKLCYSDLFFNKFHICNIYHSELNVDDIVLVVFFVYWVNKYEFKK